MAAYKIFFKKAVQKDFDPIPIKDLKRILNRIAGLAENLRPTGCEKLTGKTLYDILIFKSLFFIELQGINLALI